jgi:hypothetical protein
MPYWRSALPCICTLRHQSGGKTASHLANTRCGATERPGPALLVAWYFRYAAEEHSGGRCAGVVRLVLCAIAPNLTRTAALDAARVFLVVQLSSDAGDGARFCS